MVISEIESEATIDHETFRSTLDYIRPRADELTWQSIPWQTDMYHAMQVARDDGKPVLLWTMNGNPLGCT